MHAVKYFQGRRDGSAKKCRNEKESKESYVATQVMMVCDYNNMSNPLKLNFTCKELLILFLLRVIILCFIFPCFYTFWHLIPTKF